MKKYIKSNRCCFAGALLAVLFSTIFAVVLQFFKGDVLDYAASGDVQRTVRSAILLFAFILCEVLLYFVHNRLSAGFVAGCTKELKRDIFASILKRSYVSYKEHPQGEYIAKYTSEADVIKERCFDLLPLASGILFKIIFVSAALFALDWRIAVITIVLLTTPLYIPKIIERRLKNAQTAYIRALEDKLTMVNDWLSAFEIIKNYSIEHRIMAGYRKFGDAVARKMLKDAQLGAVSQLITTLISYLSYFVVLAFAAGFVLNGDFTAGDFFIAIGMIDQLSWPLVSLAGIIRQLIAVRPTCVAMKEFLNCSGSEQKSGKCMQLKSCICFEDVSFSYDGDRKILSRFNLIIEKGKRYLLKGPSGSGKTTVINLLLRYYDACSGSIYIDGTRIEKIASTYDLITVVRQDAILLHDTLRNNLSMYGDYPDSRLCDVLKSVGLERFADVGGLEMLVAEKGSNFSGGEQKRICLARALLRNTDMLVLDEPLANLDPESAERIEDLLLNITDKTVIVVSHQFTEEKLSAFDRVVNLA